MRLIPDETWAALTVWMEARGESQFGRVAVAEVIRNRVARRYNCDGTVPGAVLQPAQFSCWSTRDPNRLLAARLEDTDALVPQSLAAWREALTGTQVTRGALLYYAPGVVAEPDWVKHCVRTVTIGRHAFYRLGPA